VAPLVNKKGTANRLRRVGKLEGRQKNHRSLREKKNSTKKTNGLPVPRGRSDKNMTKRTGTGGKGVAGHTRNARYWGNGLGQIKRKKKGATETVDPGTR